MFLRAFFALRSKSPLIAGFAALGVLIGCPLPPAVTVSYHQVGACNGGQGQSGDPSTFYNAGPNQAYVIFDIEKIDNTTRSSVFNFDSTQVFTNSGSVKSSLDPTLMVYAQKLGPFAVGNYTVAAGKDIGFFAGAYGALVVQTSASDGASEADRVSYFLGYTGSNSGGVPPVIMSNTQSSVTSWPYTPNCADISLH